ncbi:transposable element Tcb1 transposase [Trichonephila clavipes]|nr:transposable element Tcb1 transposase [Trichonephila clavipes]
MVWGGIGFHCPTPLAIFAGTRNSQRYISGVLQPVVLPCIQCLPSAIFQRDNTQPHVARNVFFTHQIKLLLWSACSPDLSQIENVWSMLAQRLARDAHPLLHHINFGNIWKLHGVLYPKDSSKTSLILCRGVWQRI